MGSFGLEAANGEVAQADVVLAVGTSFGAVDTCGENPDLIDTERQAVFQIEIEPRNAAWTYPGVQALVGDAGTTLRDLHAALGDRRAGADAQLGAAHARGSFDTADSLSDAVPVLPQRVVHELWSRLPETAVVNCDAGENRLFMAHHYRTGAINGFVQPGGIGGMGFAIPAALGAKLAEPGRLSVAVCGDGGFAMSMLGLMTSIEERIPIAVIVLNNRMLGWTRHSQGDRPIASEFHDFDHAAIARGIGCKGLTATTPAEVADAIDQIGAEPDVTTVVDVRVSPDESYLKTRSSYARDWASLVR
jgi:acetolactate synthase-1/2/3 large subunit